MIKGKYAKLWLKLIVVFASIMSLAVLLCVVVFVSFQNGTESSGVTMKAAAQIRTVSLMIRYGAHLAMFFVVGLVTAFVSMVIFSHYFRIIGIALSGVVCYMLAYYTEYFKQFVEGRHFQMSDVSLNWYGGLAGILCMVVSYFLNRLLVKLS